MTTASIAEKVLSARTPAGVADAVEQLAGPALEQITSSMPKAIAGERAQIRLYVMAYRSLENRLLDAVEAARPGLIILDEAHVVSSSAEKKSAEDGERDPVPWLTAALEQGAMSVPFGEWVGALGVRRGTAVAVASQLRSLLRESKPLTTPKEHAVPGWPVNARDATRFYRAVSDELAREELPLERIASVLELSRTELAQLFGVRRQAIEQWEARGVPGERQVKLATLGAIVDVLAAKLKPERIPGVVRRPAAAYGERAILDAIAADDETLVLDQLRDAFDWAAAA
jgi:DNA-binding XRE family transcriptional regulator